MKHQSGTFISFMSIKFNNRCSKERMVGKMIGIEAYETNRSNDVIYLTAKYKEGRKVNSYGSIET